MPRQPRAPGEFFHVVVRGIGRQILFENDDDRRKYLALLEKYREENDITLMAYCLMDNHVHLLIRDNNGSLSLFMKQMGVSYALYYNRKYDRVGHLFQDRYKSEVVDREEYLLTAYRYILNNPVKAGICSAKEYAWSSYKEYGTPLCLTDTDMLYNLIGDEKALDLFLSQDSEIVCLESERTKRDDAWALKELQKLLRVESGTELQQFDRKRRNEALQQLKKHGLTVRQIERLTGINRGVVQRA